MVKMVFFRDASGIPRAWAFGPEAQLDQVKAVARRQLDAYIKSKEGLGGYEMDPEKYTMGIEDIPKGEEMKMEVEVDNGK
jgi:hypothetical protein